MVSNPNHAAFDKRAFQAGLAQIPQSTLFNMAEDGVICAQEIAHIFHLMNLPPEQIAALRQHQAAIAQLVLHHATQQMRLKSEKGICKITGAQAAAIMQELLEKGMIERVWQQAQAVRAAPAKALQRDEPAKQR